MPPETRYLDLSDTRLPYLDYDGSGPAVVMVHATGFMPWLWDPIARELARDYRVVAPCFCNHRPADPLAGGLAWLQLADDLKQLCSRLNIREAFLIGHSMGATTAILAHVLRGMTALAMVLIEPILLTSESYRVPVSLAQHPLAARAIKRRNHWCDRAEALADFKNKPFFRSWDSEVLGLYAAYGLKEVADGVQLYCSPQREAALFMGSQLHDPWPELPKVTCPTLVVEGENSDNRTWIDLQRVVDLIPQGQYAQVDGAGHLIPMEKPGQTTHIIQSFLRNRGKAGTAEEKTRAAGSSRSV